MWSNYGIFATVIAIFMVASRNVHGIEVRKLRITYALNDTSIALIKVWIAS